MKKIILIIILVALVGSIMYLLSGTTEKATLDTAPSVANDMGSTTPENSVVNTKIMEDGTLEPTPKTTTVIEVIGELELPKEIEVSYTDNGFNPIIAIVEQGATVKFTNDSRITMWVASNPHPDHSAYSNFNSKTAVPPGAAYSFTFTKIGSWKYHNDTATSHTGTITVE